MIYLLDVNVLLALGVPEHTQHVATRRWFLKHREQGWATCLVTQSGFVRVSSKGSAGVNRRPEVAIEFLHRATNDIHHHWWPMDRQVHSLHPQIRQMMIGPSQVTDFLLLELAYRKSGKLATYDARLANTFKNQADLTACIELLPDPLKGESPVD
jgi:uncharacterized protein